MTFELLPAFAPFAYAFIVLAALIGLTSFAVLGSALISNRRTRVARSESVRTYYGRLMLAH